MQVKEMIEAVKNYKKRIAGSFVLVDGKDITRKISGEKFIATKKLDGTFQGLIYDNGEICAASSSGKVISDVPCLKEAAELLRKSDLQSAIIEAELYAVLNSGKRERVADVSAALADEALSKCLFLAPFDISMIDGENYHSDNYLETIQKLYSIFNGKLVKPVEYREIFSVDKLNELFAEWVEEGGSEGIVLHSELPIVYKIKPHHTVDGVIVGYTCEEDENADSVRDIAVALMNKDSLLQIVGVTGNGFTTDQRKSLKQKLDTIQCESEYIITDSRNVAFQMVEPKIVAEFNTGDYVSESSDGTAKTNPLLLYSNENGYQYEGNTNGVAIQHLIFKNFREDKVVNETDIRISQITDICPFKEGNTSCTGNLDKSEILARRVFKKESAGKLMVQKYVVWKTNKEESNLFPAYVFFYTDFSSGRTEMLKRDMMVSSDKEQVMKFMEESIAKNVKKGWIEI